MHFQNTIRGKNLSPVWLFFPCILCLVSMGCTMCPSPFDYSGTVPGSANQNNFRIRSNGVLPIWRRPKPWPPIVSTEADESPSASREAEENTTQTSRVIVASHEEGAEDEHAQDSSVLIPQLPAPASTNDEPANSAE
jgi:hypothetical protein